MAGESPDKVEREESSGETTDDGGAVASRGGKKSGSKSGAKTVPKGGTARNGKPAGQAGSSSAGDGGDAEAGSGEGAGSAGSGGNGGGGGASGGRNDDRLKAAVAAWVAGGDDEADGEPGDGEGSGDAAEGESGKPEAGEKKTSQIAETDLPVRPKSDGADDSGGADVTEEASGASSGAAKGAGEVDHPTAMFRAVRPGSADSEGEDDGEAAARRAERMTSAFFGPGRSGKAKEEEKADEAATSGRSEEVGEQSAPSEAGKPGEAETAAASSVDESASADEPAAMKEGDSADESESPDAVESADEPRAADGAASAAATDAEETGPDRETSRVDEPTASFRTRDVADAAAEPGSADATDARDAEEAGPGGATTRVDEPTASFRTLEPDKPEKKNGSVDQPTTAFRTIEPAEAEESAEAAKPEKQAEAEESAKPGKAEEPAKAAKAEEPAKPAKSEGSAKAEEPPKPEKSEKPEESEEAEKPAKPAKAEEPAEPADPRVAGYAGDGKKKAAGSKSGPESGSTESESERTSQFVPLRSAEALQQPTRKPDSAAPPKSTTALPGEMPAEAALEPQLSEAERTRQEVRPDQAPLDLLAQLTNTPPRPETPLRTAARRVKIWTPLVLLLAVVFVIAQSVRPLPEAELSLTASPSYTFQGPKPAVPWPSEGQAALDVQGLGSFGSSGKQKPVPIASVAKVMTAYVILREHPVKKGSDGAMIPVDKKAEDEAGLSAQNESTVEVKQGDKISQREAVEAIMIASANNVARLLARWDAGSEKAFAKKMNAAAEDLGMDDTEYTDPSGLNASTVSTAEDQVKLAKKAMGIDLFRKTVRLPGYTDTKGEEHGNWNKLVPLDGVVGIKTGTTTKAGGNLLFAAEKKVGGTKQLIVGAVLGQYRPSILDTVLGESKKLIDTAQDALRAQQVVSKGDVVGYVDDQLGGRTPVVATRDVSAVGWSGVKVNLGLTDSGKALPHQGSAGDKAGVLTVGDGPGQVRVPVALKEDMTEPGFGAKLTRIL